MPPSIIETIISRLDILKGDYKDIRLFNIPYIIDSLTEKIKRDIIREEVLIITDNEDEAFRIINSLSNKFSFLSVLGLNEVDGENIYEDVLDNIGISVYIPNFKSISLKRYGLIINTLDNLPINFKKIRKNAIIIDFSMDKPLKGVNRYVIDDVSIDISDLGLVDNPWLNKEVNSNLYGSLFKGENKIFCRLLNNDSLINMEDFVVQGLKIKGGF